MNIIYYDRCITNNLPVKVNQMDRKDQIDRLNQLDDNCFKFLIDFLEIQEYMSIVSLSKHINAMACKYKKQKKPFIVVYNSAYGGYGTSDECHEEIKRIRESNSLVFHQNKDALCSRNREYLVQAILNIGSKKASKKYCSLGLHAVPWMFRNSIEIDEYDGKETVRIDYNKYRYNMLEKAKNKIDEINDSKGREAVELDLFRKLLQKHELLKKYKLDDDKHMEMFNDRLDKIVYLDEY